MKALYSNLLIALSVGIGFGTSALGQDYPNRSVKVLLGYPAGAGALDSVVRATAQALSQTLGQSFVVDNKPGAGGTIATAQAAQSSADGYTLLAATTGELEIAPYLRKSLPYDTLRDLTPIGMIFSTPMYLSTNPQTKIKTIKDLISEAKVNPGKFSHGSSGIGSPHHIMVEAFAAAAGIKLTHIPYKGSNQTIPALLSGEVQLIMATYGSASQLLGSGKMILLGVSSEKRVPYTPDVASISEEIPGYDFASEQGLLGPSGLPPEVLAKLSRGLKAAIEAPSMQEYAKKWGFPPPVWISPEAYREKIRHNLKKYEQAIKIANIQPN